METSELTSASFWQSERCQVLVNPHDMGALEQAGLIESWAGQQPELVGHLLFATSGSSGGRKWVALSRQALLASASMVNQHLSAGADDRWLLALPDFHVGGMGIIARCYDAGCEFVKLGGKWNPELYHRIADSEQISFSSLVPTQLYDLVQRELRAPKSLRALIIGGGRLSDSVYDQAIKLGWPVMETYGMTEAGSQVATSGLGSRDLEVLTGWQVKVGDDDRLIMKGKALLTGYVSCSDDACQLYDPKQDGWFASEDVGLLDGGKVFVKGRMDRCVKVLGELINLAEVEAKVAASVSEVLPDQSMVVVAIQDSRKGYRLILCSDKPVSLDHLCSEYNLRCHPVERLDGVCLLAEIPRSPLGKVLYGELARKAADQIAEGE